MDTGQEVFEKGDHSGSSPVEITMDTPEKRLQEYEALKFELAQLIREGSSAAWHAKNDTLQRDFQSLLQRLAEDRFYLTLAGQFSRGKSTLMNAMLGMDRLPTGIVPVTSVITAVSYNSTERVRMHFEGSNLTHEVPLSELSEWITEQGNPGNQRKIDMAEVQLPAELLRRGAFFVDTPGLGSAVIANTKTTHRFLPHIDALVLVTSFEFPLSQEEMVFLSRMRQLQRRIFIVVNKEDLCTPAQRDQVLAFIGSRVAEETGSNEIPIFPVSAFEALAAKLAGDSEKLDRSGLPVFEQTLVDYLIGERAGDFLRATCDRIEALLSYPEVPGLRDLDTRLEDIRAKVQGQNLSQRESKRPSRSVAEMPTTASVKISSCFVCRQMADATFKFMSHFQYDISHSRDEQLLHASRSGFCSLHSREYARLASPQGIASGYPNTLLFVAEHLALLYDHGRIRDDWKEEFEEFLPGFTKCRACQSVAEIESEIIDIFVRDHESLSSSDEDDLPCVCLRHLKAIVERVPHSKLASQMVAHSAAVLQRTAENMERFAMRHGGHHMELVTDEELASPEKALNLLVGQPNVRPTGS